jgi:hypothetical protein
VKLKSGPDRREENMSKKFPSDSARVSEAREQAKAAKLQVKQIKLQLKLARVAAKAAKSAYKKAKSADLASRKPLVPVRAKVAVLKPQEVFHANNARKASKRMASPAQAVKRTRLKAKASALKAPAPPAVPPSPAEGPESSAPVAPDSVKIE